MALPMIRASVAVARGRAMLGTPYTEMDCISFIVRILRTCPGGDRKYRTAGTNTLWKSAEASGKYRDLTWQKLGTEGARAGMLAFKIRGEDVHHVGLVTGEGTVLHASSVLGRVSETPLDGSWHALAVHRLIRAEDGAEAKKEAKTEARTETGTRQRDRKGDTMTAIVHTDGGRLNLRTGPGGQVLARLDNGTQVEVLETGEWARIVAGQLQGYVKSEFLALQEEPVQMTVLEETETGIRIRLAGLWRALED